MTGETVFRIADKVSWQIELSSSWETLFYPSLAKKLQKDIHHFQNTFTFSVIDADETFLKEIFFPLYEKEVASRDYYHLQKEAVFTTALHNIKTKKIYKFLSVFLKTTDQFVGGILFSVQPPFAATSLRVFDKTINHTYRKNTTVDYWAESQLISYLQSQHVTILTHGRDKQPRNEKSLGLFLFKLSLGAKPIQSPESQIINQTLKNLLSQSHAAFFFDNPNKQGQYQKANLFSASEVVNPVTVAGFEHVLAWAHILFIQDHLQDTV